MPTVVQFRRGTTAQNNNFLGANGEISVDTTLNVLRVADAVTQGGFAMVGQDCVQTIANKTYTGTSLSVTGNVTGGNLITGGLISATTLSATANVIGGNITTAGLITATGNITGGNINGNGSGLSSLTGANVTGTVANATYAVSAGSATTATSATSATTAATVTTNAQPNITSVGTLTSVSVSGNVTGSYILGNGSQLTGLSASKIFNGTSEANVTSSGGNITFTIGGTAIFGISTAGIFNAQGNGVGNIGNATTYFNTVFAKATSAQYADLAEMYTADVEYAPGTVVEFGGNYEITATTATHSTQVAGIISTQPAYLMNATQAGQHPLEVALVGRVPCLVVGTIVKGDRLVSSHIAGVATVLDMNLHQPGCIVGKALEEYNSTEPGVIEVAVGRA